MGEGHGLGGGRGWGEVQGVGIHGMGRSIGWGEARESGMGWGEAQGGEG